MSKVDFDNFSENYNEILKGQLRFFGEKDIYFAEYKVKLIKKYIKSEPKRILEYGCGIGRNLKFLLEQFPNSEIYGCDVSEKSLGVAAQDFPRAHLFLLGKDIINDKFDLIFMANVIHHIKPESRMRMLKEMHDMLTSDGCVFIFEHNPYNPVTRHLVSTCPFDEDAELLKSGELKRLLSESGFVIQETRYTLFFPAFLKFLRFLEVGMLAYMPFGGQYFILAKK